MSLTSQWAATLQSGLEVVSDDPLRIMVVLGSRRHTVQVQEGPDWIRISARSVPPDRLADLGHRGLLALTFAAEPSEFVRLVVSDGWLLAVADLPRQSATVQELSNCVRAVATAADRREMIWTGLDVE